MKKMKCLLVLALGAMLVLGSAGILNGQEVYELKRAPDENSEVQRIKARVNPGIRNAVAALRFVLRDLEGKTQEQLDAYAEEVKSIFYATCFRDREDEPAGRPILKNAQGMVVAEGWRAVLDELWSYQHPSTGNIRHITIGGTNVFLGYRAYDTQHQPPGNRDTDLTVDVQTTLTGSPNPLFVLYGASEHRRSCDPYP